VKLVVNRFEKGNEITPSVIAESAGAPVAATVANDYPAVVRAVNRGRLLVDEAPRAQIAKDVQQLVTVLGHPLAEEAPQPRPSFLRRILSPRTSHAAS
jgi:pilus assembly protein CpaE